MQKKLLGLILAAAAYGVYRYTQMTPEQKAELESLQNTFMNQPVVQEYFKAQTGLATLCQAVGDRLSESIGLNYAAACGVSCCG
jgi:cell fate (sporulation/competence/biofilm development) regulator YmcA (YheA/YmcA/DUF963 family)